MRTYAFYVPEKSRALTNKEMELNALAVGIILRHDRWTAQAVAGVLGNMQAESTINPGRWEDDDEDSDLEERGGYGLVQWTPYTKYSDWAGSGWERNGKKEVERIIYEKNNGLQWIATSKYNFSFKEFTRMTATPEYMADAFLKNYERPENTDQPARGQYARKWYKYIKKYLYPNLYYYYMFRERQKKEGL